MFVGKAYFSRSDACESPAGVERILAFDGRNIVFAVNVAEIEFFRHPAEIGHGIVNDIVVNVRVVKVAGEVIHKIRIVQFVVFVYSGNDVSHRLCEAALCLCGNSE